MDQFKHAMLGNGFAQELSQYLRRNKDLFDFRSSMPLMGDISKELMAAVSPAAQAIQAWQASQRDQQELMRRAFEPMADIGKSFILDQSTRQLIKDAASAAALWHDHYKDVFSELEGIGSVAHLWAKQMEVAGAQNHSILGGLKLGSSIGQYFKDFELINKQWRVPPELLGVVGSLKEIQEKIGNVAIPTIDWGAAAALAKLLGEEGLNKQFSYLGIQPDGSLDEYSQASEKGLLSRKQSDAVALVGLLLAIIGIWMSLQMFYIQESSGALQQAKSDEQAARQMRQLESLNRLVEKALEQVSKVEEERFVVRERIATVRAEPKHGAAVEGKLML